MEVYLVTEKSELFDDMQIILEDYDDARAYVHDEISKIMNFVVDHPAPIQIDTKVEEFRPRYEEPILDSSYKGTLFVHNTFWDTETPIATIEVHRHDVFIFDDGDLKTTPRSRAGRYISYGSK